MINTDFGNSILKSLFGQGELYFKGKTGNQVLIDKGLGASCYLGLLTNRDQSKELQEDNTYPTYIDPATIEEIKDGQYSRVCLGNLSVPQLNLLIEPTNCEISNANEFIMFPELDPNPSKDVKHVITHFGLYASKTGGTPVYAEELNAPITATKGQVILFRKGEFKMTIGKDKTISTQVNAASV